MREINRNVVKRVRINIIIEEVHDVDVETGEVVHKWVNASSSVNGANRMQQMAEMHNKDAVVEEMASEVKWAAKQMMVSC